MRISQDQSSKADAPVLVLNMNKVTPEEEYLRLEDQGLLYNQQTAAPEQQGA